MSRLLTRAQRIAIVGSREWPGNGLAVLHWMDYLLEATSDVEIVSGGAGGVDRMAKEAAKIHHVPYREFPADWKPDGVNYDRRAGARRNQQIVNYADRVVAFWDGSSPGTKITIDMALRAHKHLEVIFP